MFGGLEGSGAQIIEQVIASGCAPLFGTADSHALLNFILFQYGRTKSHAEANDEQLDKISKFAVEKEGSLTPEEIASVRIKFNNPTVPSLKAIAECIPVAIDLKCKVLRNATDIQFITSDHPVVLYNQYGEDRVFRSNIGLACKGLQVFYPVSPRHVVMLYDAAIYKLGQRRDTFAEVTQRRDVEQLNDLQWLNALENVYFHDGQDRAEIFRGHRVNAHRRNAEKTRLVSSEPQDKGDGRYSAIVAMSKIEHRTHLDLKFVRYLQTISPGERDSGTLLLRNPALSRAHDDFLKLMDEGKYRASEFQKFLQEHRR